MADASVVCRPTRRWCVDRRVGQRVGGIEFFTFTGFTIEDLLSLLNCSFNIPLFLSEKVQFSKEDVERTQKIAKLRIHVERPIRRVKENHLFDAVIPLSLASSINQIWSVSCMLSNFKGPLF